MDPATVANTKAKMRRTRDAVLNLNELFKLDKIAADVYRLKITRLLQDLVADETTLLKEGHADHVVKLHAEFKA